MKFARKCSSSSNQNCSKSSLHGQKNHPSHIFPLLITQDIKRLASENVGQSFLELQIQYNNVCETFVAFEENKDLREQIICLRNEIESIKLEADSKSRTKKAPMSLKFSRPDIEERSSVTDVFDDEVYNADTTTTSLDESDTVELKEYLKKAINNASNTTSIASFGTSPTSSDESPRSDNSLLVPEESESQENNDKRSSVKRLSENIVVNPRDSFVRRISEPFLEKQNKVPLKKVPTRRALPPKTPNNTPTSKSNENSPSATENRPHPKQPSKQPLKLPPKRSPRKAPSKQLAKQNPFKKPLSASQESFSTRSNFERQGSTFITTQPSEESPILSRTSMSVPLGYEKFITLSAYNAEDPKNELTFDTGEILYINPQEHTQSTDGWVIAYDMRNNKKGYVPISFVAIDA